MNVNDMLLELRERLGERAAWDSTDWSSIDVGNFWRNASLVRWLNQGQERFNHADRWPWLLRLRSNVAIGIGVDEIELIDDVDLNRQMGLKLVLNTDSKHILLPKKVTPFNGMELSAQYTTTGEPMWYYAARSLTNIYNPGTETETRGVATRLKIVPVPDRAYTAEFVYYQNGAAPFIDLEQEPDLPDVYHEAVVSWAEFRAWARDKSARAREKALDARAIFLEVVEEARKETKASADDERTSPGGREPLLSGISRMELWKAMHLPPNVGL